MMIRVQGDKGWINGLRHQADRCGLLRSGIEAVGIDALALTSFLGVGADINEIFAVGWSRICGSSVKGPQEECQEGDNDPDDVPTCFHSPIEAHQLLERKRGFGSNFIAPLHKSCRCLIRMFRESPPTIHFVRVMANGWS